MLREHVNAVARRPALPVSPIRYHKGDTHMTKHMPNVTRALGVALSLVGTIALVSPTANANESTVPGTMFKTVYPQQSNSWTYLNSATYQNTSGGFLQVVGQI